MTQAFYSKECLEIFKGRDRGSPYTRTNRQTLLPREDRPTHHTRGTDMPGIVFHSTQKLDDLKTFYNDLGATIWVDQGDCIILNFNNFLLGFCQRDQPAETCGMLTLFYRTKEEVDAVYDKVKDCATGPPKENTKYNIYQFFAKDPEGRTLEFQVFLHAINWDW